MRTLNGKPTIGSIEALCAEHGLRILSVDRYSSSGSFYWSDGILQNARAERVYADLSKQGFAMADIIPARAPLTGSITILGEKTC